MTADENKKELLEEYKKFLLDLYNTKSNEFFTNGGKDHATILLTILYSKAQHEVKTFCEGLHPDIFSEGLLHDTFMEYVQKGNTIQVLMESDKFLSSHPAKDIIGLPNVDIRIIQEEDKRHIFETLHLDRCNFSVFDQRMVRLETDPADYKAVGSFNKTEWAEALTKLFDAAFNQAAKIAA